MKKILIMLTILALSIPAVSIASDLVIDSKTQSFSEKDNKIKFDGDVQVSIDDIKVVGDKADVDVTKDNKLDVATFYDKPYAFEIKNNKKREVKANILKVSLINKIIRAEGDSQSIVTDGKLPIVVINADTQEYDTNTNIMTADGSVIIKYKELETFSDKAVIKTDKNGDLKKIDLYGNAKLKEGLHNAEADHFIYDPVKQELIAIGNTTSKTTMDDGSKLTLKSHYQQYSQKHNVFSGSGDVKVWYQDYYAEGPKISFYPDKKTNKPNEIYFTGRSSITQKEKTIYADKIKMVLKPKTFFAEGNTRTIIRDIKTMEDSEI